MRINNEHLDNIIIRRFTGRMDLWLYRVSRCRSADPPTAGIRSDLVDHALRGGTAGGLTPGPESSGLLVMLGENDAR
jgi:hypothetical protein